MNLCSRTTLLLGFVWAGTVFSADAWAAGRPSGPSGPNAPTGVATATPPARPSTPPSAHPEEDEIVEVIPGSAPDAPGAARAPIDLKGRLDLLEQQNSELTNRLKDLERRLNIVTNPPTSVRLNGYVDFGFFAFFRGNGSGITNYTPNPPQESQYTGIADAAARNAAIYNDARVRRFPAFFAPCGFDSATMGALPCPRAPLSGPNQTRWHFLGDPLATAINSAGHPADIRAQNNPSQSSQAVPYDYIQSAGRPTFIINEVNINPVAKLGEGFQAFASINFYPRSASVSIGDKQDAGSVVPAGPTKVGDYIWVDMAYLEYATAFRNGRHQLSLFAGRFDPNIGIEYRVRKSPDRFGVTPSLICRYSCGTPIGLKARGQFFDEFFTIALAVQNSASYQEQLFRFAENTDKKYMKTISGRASIHCSDKNHCQKFNLEVGLSGEFGGEVDGFYDVGRSEFDPFVKQWTVDVDVHFEYRGLELRAEYLRTEADGFIGSDSKPALPRLSAQGAYFEGSYRVLNWLGAMLRWDVRDAVHVDYSVPFAYDSLLWRLTVGARFDINDNIAFKAEYLHLQPFGRMAEGLADMKTTMGPMAIASTAGDYAADYLTTSLVLRY